MANLQLKGPRNEDTGPVKYFSTFLRSSGEEADGLLVTFQLGDQLRRCFTDKNVSIEGVYDPIFSTCTDTKKIGDNPCPGLSIPPASNANNTPASLIGPSLNGLNAAPVQAREEVDTDSDIEIIEVRPAQRMRPVHSSGTTWGSTSSFQIRLSDTTGSDTDGNSSSELSALDSQINQVLSPNLTISSQKPYFQRHTTQPIERSVKNMPPIHSLLPEFFKPHATVKGPPPPGYRNIPPNLVYAINRELNIWMETPSDDDIEMVEKLVFTLKDPIVKTKIKLPIKATTCRHFECFDFQTFCEFHGLKPGVKSLLKSTLVQQSREARAAENLFLRQQQRIAAKTLSSDAPEILFPFFSEHGQMFFTELYNRTPPLYKCPLCDEKFGLKQLYISDIFNFFVKTTPLHITKVQLEGARFKIVEDDKLESTKEEAEIVDLSEEDEEEEEEEDKEESDKEKEDKEERDERDEGEKENSKEQEKDTGVKEQTGNTENSGVGIESMASKIGTLDTGDTEKADRSTTADDFNDGLDEVLMTMSKGDGSWSHPVTLD
ncbi:hypothetical protein METBIDRAFT_210085 [Metschnikowia bicuspidata var. bicuspidata NRRL YB-4993]|uniref:SP-RING-type domain-containing protein n=1 Tax=Metschnikowia bicuspidata var. bicuspidata NRRL YB-4993 TaxID=869754 RepID=A0A1A0H7R8_9ASCO|nr:hypothetical protein METBIDRAFT_210085 [Metschnikowia bicuspidata var. bicuspidata NRRL YB-4993]OBA19937.1 hypothetical protein METBIDRAFT_210085 [Metschnikowia bicuspidata var. bicuspidata NRRL YB-4993]